jgi:hypothetical protein
MAMSQTIEGGTLVPAVPHLTRPPSRPSHTVIATVTPGLAAEWLEHNNDMNRVIRDSEVTRYALDITEGRWDDTTDPIKFDENNQMADGQQRCSAIVEAGIPVECHVSYDLPASVRLVIDDGRKRSFADDLHMNGRPRSTETEALLRKILTWRDTGGLNVTGGTKRLSRAQLAQKYIPLAAEMRDAFGIADEHRKLPCSRPVAQFMAWLLSRYAPEKVIHRYLSILSIGSQEPADRVLVRLKERLERSRTDARMGLAKSYTAHEVYWMIRGWNAWLTDEHLRTFNLPAGGLRPGLFPAPIEVGEAQ